MASSSVFSVVSFSSVNNELSTRPNLVPVNPRLQFRRICDLRVRNFKSSASRNVISASVSFPAQEVSPSQRRPDELTASIFSKVFVAEYISFVVVLELN
ncbi:hypothetical protein HanXRQr2_Chr11g0510881 [Helianthus annuus]|uniref:Uncharacterized protein n=1 Tax=Helianthus annuus TaxID=4232 RepID=A0A251VB10_HELAN|nr:hypothetical protein HanXRQr2_Chr11g0510881 [Helianthus annuus]KAJ0518942.1 hypothetical protein HanHA89_Chr11g0443061 [Helianthus annuus]KAJ0876759.1 hypothetical protein HanPSC8_Chr11g0492121 [Helianthus annuus]